MNAREATRRAVARAIYANEAAKVIDPYPFDREAEGYYEMADAALDAIGFDALAILDDLVKSYDLYARNNTDAAMLRFVAASVNAVERARALRDAREPA